MNEKYLLDGVENSRIPNLPRGLRTLYISVNDLTGSAVFLIPNAIVAASKVFDLMGISSA